MNKSILLIKAKIGRRELNVSLKKVLVLKGINIKKIAKGARK